MADTAHSTEETAAAWAIRLAAGALPREEQRQLDAWLAADIRHLGALVKARAQWSDLDRLGALAGDHASAVPQQASRLQWNRRSLIAACLGGTGLVGLGWSILAPAGEYYATGVGEMRRIPLQDGSTLILNTHSAARVTFAEDRREVRLLQGEALFEVAHDLRRPFIVMTDSWQVRAVGTVFGVRLRGAEVDVTVSEGAVELNGKESGQARRIAANEQSILAPMQPIRVEKIPVATVERRFAWLNGMVAFSGESLAEAVAEINRHNRQQIVVDEAVLARQPIVGAFKATDSETFAAAAAAALNAETVLEDGALHLRSRNP